jgi:uncharacterized iron-regulated membrane protein
VAVRWNRLNRKIHHWTSIIVALPLLLILCTGMLLLVKKQISWIQPETRRGQSDIPALEFSRVLDIARTVPEAEIKSWEDIDRLDVRPSKGIIKIRSKNNWEIQIDHTSGEILQTAFRRSDIIESIHDGSIFHSQAKPWLFLTCAMGFLLLWITGIYLFVIAHRPKKRSPI